MQCLSALRTARTRALGPVTSIFRLPKNTNAVPHQLHPLSLATTSQFSTSTPLQARKKDRAKRDMRIVLIRYHLSHPLTPRPLRFSRVRSLRHWTIHRAWQLHKAQKRRAQEMELERQYNSMRDACEALRLIGENGLAISEPGTVVPPPGSRDRAVVPAQGEMPSINVGAAAERQQEVGRLYRIAMEKKGIWGGVPIEYARAQTDTPARQGWDYAWTR